MQKSVEVTYFNKDGMFLAKGELEFDSELNRPRRTYMPAAKQELQRMWERGELPKLFGNVEVAKTEGNYVLINDRYGYPVLVRPEEFAQEEGEIVVK